MTAGRPAPRPGPMATSRSAPGPGYGHLCRPQACPAFFALLFLPSSMHSLQTFACLGSGICTCERQSVPAFSVTTVDTCCWPLPSPVGTGRPCKVGGVPAPNRSGEQRAAEHRGAPPCRMGAGGLRCPRRAWGDACLSSGLSQPCTRQQRKRETKVGRPSFSSSLSPQVGGESPCQPGGVYTGRSWDLQPTGSEQAVTSGHLGTHHPHPRQRQLRDRAFPKDGSADWS